MPNPTISSLTLPVKNPSTGEVTNVTYDLPSGGGGSTYTAGDGIDITNDVISVDEMPSSDMGDIISPPPAGGGGGGAIELDDITDVTITNATSGQVLKYDGSGWVNGEGGSGGTSDYTDLSNKPQIEGVTLSGNKTASDLGLAKASDIPTKNSLGLDNVVNTGDSDTPTSGGTTKFTTGGAYTLKQDVDKAYKTSDSAETTLADSDKFPFYDASASGKRSSTWSNIKSKLKTYFDTLYNNYTLPTATSSVLGGVKIGDNMTIEDGVINPSYLVVANQFDKADLYSTTEKVVGCWTDGRPIYQKTISIGAMPNATQKNVAHGITNLGTVVDVNVLFSDGTYSMKANYTQDINFYNKSSDTNVFWIDKTNITVYCESNRSAYTGVATVKYTKTTDAANSFKYADENDYSTSEKIVGTWIDGKPIYQKTLSATVPAIHTTSNVATITNVDRLIKTSFNGKNNDGSTVYRFSSDNTYNVGYTSTGPALQNSVGVYMSSNNIIVSNDGSSFWAGTTIYITLQYTKTTD